MSDFKMPVTDRVMLDEITKRTKALKDALETLSAYGHSAEARRIKNTYQINLGDEA